MKKRVFAGMLAAMMMVSMMVTTAFAADPNELEVRATTLDTNGLPDGYDDYLGGTIMPHGESKPSIRACGTYMHTVILTTVLLPLGPSALNSMI